MRINPKTIGVKVLIREAIVLKSFSSYTKRKAEILHSFNSPFRYLGDEFYNASFGLLTELPKERYEEFHPYYVEFKITDKLVAELGNHLTNYFNQCNTIEDALLIIPVELRSRILPNHNWETFDQSKVTVINELVVRYQQSEIFQCALDRLVVFGDL